MRRQYRPGELGATQPPHDQNQNYNNQNSDDSKLHRQWLGNRYLYCLLFVSVICFYLIHWEHTRFIHPVTVQESIPGQFVSEHARENLNKITSFGERLVGSKSNEVEVVQYLMSELDAIKRNAKRVHKLDVDLQSVTGTFALMFLGEFTQYYENMQNVVARFGPSTGAKHSLLVNCHYDSVVSSIGKYSLPYSLAINL